MATAPAVAAIVDGRLRELHTPLVRDADVTPVTLADSDGARIYRRSLAFLLVTAASEVFPEARLEGYARLTYEIEQQKESVKLTFIQEIDKPDSKLIGMASNGWPLILASLKSLLETGEPLAETRRFEGHR